MKFLFKHEYATTYRSGWNDSYLVRIKEWRLFVKWPYGTRKSGILLWRITRDYKTNKIILLPKK